MYEKYWCDYCGNIHTEGLGCRYVSVSAQPPTQPPTATDIDVLRSRLAAAQAEVEQLKGAFHNEHALTRSLMTKLSILRAAAERMVKWTIGITDSECRDIVGALHAAIAASKQP